MSEKLGRAVFFDGKLCVIERPQPTTAPDEALIRLRLGGICNTDLELMAGYKAFRGVLGHEFVGEVVAGPEEWLGERVVGTINVACGRCDMCRRGVPEHCRHRAVLGIYNYDGAFADVFRLVSRNLLRVPSSVPDELAVFTEPLAAACRIAEDVHVHPTDRVVVLGAGKLGMLIAQVLKLSGANLSVVVRHEHQAALLREWGIRPLERQDVPDGLADVVVDVTGNPAGFRDALEIVRPRGTIVLKSTYHGLPQADLTRLVVDEIHVVGSRCGPFGAALRLLEQRLVDVEPLIEARYALADAVAAFEHAARRGALKVLLTP